MEIIKKSLFLAGIILIIVSSSFVTIYGNSDYERLGNIILALFGILFLLILPKILTNRLPPIVIQHFAVILFTGLLFLILEAYRLNYSFSDLREIIIPLIPFLFGYFTFYKKEELVKTLILYSVAVMVMGIYKVYTNVGGFGITEQYLFESKNQITPMISSAIIVLTYLILYKGHNNRKIRTIMLMGISIILFAILVVSRGRASIISAMIVLLYLLLFKTNKVSNVIILSIIIVPIIIFASPYIYASFFLNKDIYDINNFTSGRIERIVDSYDFISKNLLFGEITLKSNINIVHSYVLLKIVRYGILGSMGYLFLYICYLKNILKGCLTPRNEKNLINMGYVIMLIPFIISFSEYTFPFGPGTAQVLNFFMLGQALRIKEYNKYHLAIHPRIVKINTEIN